MTPQRIQLKRTKGWRMPPNTVKVDRATRWGNPYRGVDAVEQFDFYARELVKDRPGWLAHLRGKNLACWCKPGEPCHADVLLELANEKESSNG